MTSPNQSGTNTPKDLSGNKKKFQNGWSEEQEVLLAKWSDYAACYRWLHDRTEKQLSFSNNWITIPVIIFSTVTGSASVGLNGLVGDNPTSQKYGQISIGLVQRGSLSDEEFNNLSDIEKINKLEIEYKAKSFYIEGNYKGTPIIIARKETRSPAAGQTYLVSPYAKLKFNNIKDLPANEILAALKIPDEENIDEIKAQPGNTGTAAILTSEEKEWINKQQDS